MSAKKAPLARQKEEHGSKEKLVDKVITLLGQIAKNDGDKDELKAKLLAASNKKLLKMFAIGETIKEKFGSVDKLAEAAAQAVGRAKDSPYVSKLKALSPGKLLDVFKSAEKKGPRNKRAA